MTLSVFALVWTLMAFVLLCERVNVNTLDKVLKWFTSAMLIYSVFAVWVLLSMVLVRILGAP